MLADQKGGKMEQLDKLLWRDFLDDLKLYRELQKEGVL